MTLHHDNVVHILQGKPAESMDRYVLLDAQDWMTDEQINALWREITRTAPARRAGHFRTAAEKSIVADGLAPEIDAAWRYLEEQSLSLGRMDRSAIYGGFHIYEKDAMTDQTLADRTHSSLMDDIYRHQRHIYDLTRKYYLLGRDETIRGLTMTSRQSLLEVGCGTGRNLALAAKLYPASASSASTFPPRCWRAQKRR